MRSLHLMIIPVFIFFAALQTMKHNRLVKDKISQVNNQFGYFSDSTKEMGKKIFMTSCYSCHKDSTNPLAPGYTVLTLMTPRSIFSALTTGKMRQQAVNLSETERKAVVQWLTNRELTTTSFPKEAYTSFSIPNQHSKYDHSGWGNNIEGTGYRNADQAGITTANISSLKLKWAFAFPDASVMRGKPAVVGDWLIVGGQFGELLSINKHSGKIGWLFSASSAIRGAITVIREENSATAFFADFSSNVYAVDIKTGKQIWNKRAGYDQLSSVTGSVVVYGGIVYVPISSLEVATAANGNYGCCTSSGGVVALNAKTGQEIWRHRVIADPAVVSGKNKNGKPAYGPSGAPVWCSPTVDSKRGLLYIGTGENYSAPTTTTSDAIQALDLKTGRLVWNFQATSNDAYNLACPFFANCPGKGGPDLDFGMAPILIKKKDGKDVLVAGQKSGFVYALTADKGKLIWKTRIGKGGALGGIHWGMSTDGKYVYASNADNIIAMDKNDSSYAPSPGVYALDLNTGKVIWKMPTPECPDKKNCIAANSAAPLLIPGLVFAGALDGHIRAYATADGKILWDFDTNKTYETINGIKGKGGSIDGPAAVVSGGMLFVNSGYGMFGEIPGNVLLAFEINRD